MGNRINNLDFIIQLEGKKIILLSYVLTEEFLANMLKGFLLERIYIINDSVDILMIFVQIKKNQSKAEYELIKMICGLSGKLQVIFGDILGEEYGKKQLSFRDSSSEETIIGLADILSDGAMEIIEIGRKIHNDGLMVHLLKGHTYLSQARVESFKKHGEDLDRLKSVVKKYCREQYDSYFRIMGDDNYSGYVGTVNSGKEKERRNRKAKKESYKAFWS